MNFSALNNAVLDVFGDDSETMPVTIDGVPVQAIYDSRHFADGEGEAGSSDLITTISVRTSSVPPLTDDTPIVARGKLYRRWESRPDGQGMTVIELELIGPAVPVAKHNLDFSNAANSQYLGLLHELAAGGAPKPRPGLAFSNPANSQYLPLIMEASGG